MDLFGKPSEVPTPTDNYPQLKITDFGISRIVGRGTFFATYCGTLEYLAPELLTNPQVATLKIDMWSLGIILFIMLVGYPPFSKQYTDSIPGYPDLPTQIANGMAMFVDAHWANISPEGKHLVRSLLTSDPSKRPSAWECVSHPWVSFKRGGKYGEFTLLGLEEKEDQITFEKPSEDIPILGELTPAELLKEQREKTVLRQHIPVSPTPSPSSPSLQAPTSPPPMATGFPRDKISMFPRTPNMLYHQQKTALRKIPLPEAIPQIPVTPLVSNSERQDPQSSAQDPSPTFPPPASSRYPLSSVLVDSEPEDPRIDIRPQRLPSLLAVTATPSVHPHS